MMTVDNSVYNHLSVQILARNPSEQPTSVDGSIAGIFTPEEKEDSALLGTFTADSFLKELIPDQPVPISLNPTEFTPLPVIDADFVLTDQAVITFNNDVSSIANLNSQILLTPVASIDYLLRSSFPPGEVRNSSPSSIANSSNSFDIQLDYRFDTAGFFDDPNRRAVLEAAASSWENIIQDEFTNIPAGSELFVENPQTGAEERFIIDNEIDDLVVFVGAQDLGTGVLGEGGPSGLLTDSSLVDRYNGSNFEPWTGSVSFSNTTDWFFDPTLNTSDDIPGGSYDFFSTALHELGHVLGIGTSSAFRALTTGSSFTGSRSTVANGGTPVPLSSDLGHLMVDGQATLMDLSSSPGSRSLVAPLDTAVLADIGYLV